MGATFENVKKETETTFQMGRVHRVILFNDEEHSMGEVAAQIIRAISCTAERAWEIMLAAHTNGRAEVIVAHRERCELVAQVLEEIRLGVKVEPV